MAQPVIQRVIQKNMKIIIIISRLGTPNQLLYHYDTE